jgi:polyhydroxybutyrate depolymerase
VNAIASELRIGGRDRTFTIRVPSADRPMPLVLALHGNSPDRGRMMREWTTFDAQADAWGMAIAYPDGHEGTWADGRGVAAAEEAGVDDVAFLRAIIDWSAERHGTFPDRTVVAGVSNGAFMAQRMALAASDQVAVMAAVVAGLPAALRDVSPAHAVSAMLIHGSADRLSPIEGGYSRRRGPNGELRGRTLSLQETAERWRAIDRCPPGPGETRTTEFSSRTTVGGGAGGTQVVAWTVYGAGHAWPGTLTPPEWGEPSTDEFDAAEEICRFAEPLLIPAETRRL